MAELKNVAWNVSKLIRSLHHYKTIVTNIAVSLFAQIVVAYAVSYAVTYIATGSAKAAQGAGLAAGLFMGIGGLRGGKMGIDDKMHYNPGWEPGSMKTLAAHGLAGGIVQDRMGGSFGAGFFSGISWLLLWILRQVK